MSKAKLNRLLKEIRACEICAKDLPQGPRPVLAAATDSRVAIIGQAPGRRVHASGVPWDDPSGDRLRDWLGVTREEFYDPQRFAILPMGFCYPGTGRSGDLPPRPECAPAWHDRVLELLPRLELFLLIGQYAQKAYLERAAKNLTETVRDFKTHGPQRFPLPHPSPRNGIWLRKNPWFEADVLPALRKRVKGSLR